MSQLEEDSDLEAMTNYLLSCQTYLKENDLNGWISNFAPELKVHAVEPPKKKLRMSPGSVIWKAYEPCGRCKSSEIIEDVKEGSVVCTTCGMIQHLNLLTSIHGAHTSVDRKNAMDRFVVHRYSRVVYFRSFLQSIQGNTYPQCTLQDIHNLHQALDGKDVNPTSVLKALNTTKLTRLRRHREALCVILSCNKYKPVSIPSETFFTLLKLFRRVEFYWSDTLKEQAGGRKVFLSYPYVYYQLCVHLKLPHLTGEHHLLKSKPRLQILHKVYGRICKKAKLECKLDVFRT